MGLTDNKCDSCSEEVNFLFPIAVIEELPSGGMKMIVKYYCWDCYDIMTDAAKDELDKTDDENGKDKDEPNQPDDDDSKFTSPHGF